MTAIRILVLLLMGKKLAAVVVVMLVGIVVMIVGLEKEHIVVGVVILIIYVWQDIVIIKLLISVHRYVTVFLRATEKSIKVYQVEIVIVIRTLRNYYCGSLPGLLFWYIR